MEPTVLTITIPSYKDAEGLDRALTSLSCQTCKDFNVIVIDDNSGLEIEKIALKFTDSINIKVVVNETNLGAMKNMFGSIIYNTDSPYIFSLHEDDFIKANYIEEALNILRNNNSISFVITTPIWVEKKFPYTSEFVPKNDYELFNAATFVNNILNRRQYIFGSVIYRKKDIIYDWDLKTYDIFSDRYFLTKILYDKKTKGAEIHGAGIFVRDHSLENSDKRDSTLKIEHGINLINFYREILLSRYPKKYINILTTNELLFFYNGLKHRGSLLELYKRQKDIKLINLFSIRLLGIFSIATLPFSMKFKRCIIKLYKKIT